MNLTNLIKKSNRRINLFIFLLVSGFVFALITFFFLQNKNQEQLYMKVILGRDNQVPYWTDAELTVGNSDRSSFGIINAQIIEKESYEYNGPGRLVILLLKTRVVKDRAGLYLFKNRPISLGEFIDLRFAKVHQSGLVTYIGNKKPENNYKNIKLVIRKRGELPEIDEHISIGDGVLNNKGEKVAEIKEKRSSPAEIRTNTDTGATVITYDRTRKDIDLTITMRVSDTAEGYLFQNIQKVKVGDNLNLHFKGISLWDFRIISLLEI